MATRTYEIKGKYTDGSDYTAGTFTVSDGTNGTNGTNGRDALVYKTVLNAVAGAPVIGATLNLVEGNFNRTPVAGETVMVIYKTTAAENRTFIVLADMIDTKSATITSFVETTGKTGATGKNGVNGSNGLDALTTIFIPTLTTGEIEENVTFETDSFNRNPEIGDRFYCPVNLPNNRSGIATFGVISVDSTNTGTALLLYTETTGKTGAAGAQGKGIASVQLVEV